jgi:hypothetical protein
MIRIRMILPGTELPRKKTLGISLAETVETWKLMNERVQL